MTSRVNGGPAGFAGGCSKRILASRRREAPNDESRARGGAGGDRAPRRVKRLTCKELPISPYWKENFPWRSPFNKENLFVADDLTPILRQHLAEQLSTSLTAAIPTGTPRVGFWECQSAGQTDAESLCGISDVRRIIHLFYALYA
jgi:hypothetical protein